MIPTLAPRPGSRALRAARCVSAAGLVLALAVAAPLAASADEATPPPAPVAADSGTSTPSGTNAPSDAATPSEAPADATASSDAPTPSAAPAQDEAAPADPAVVPADTGTRADTGNPPAATDPAGTDAATAPAGADAGPDAKPFAPPVPADLHPAPVAAADHFEASQDTWLVVGVPGLLANDTGAPGDAIMVAGNDAAQHGSVKNMDAFGGFVYAPDPGFVGTDTFSYWDKNSDGVESNHVTVTIEVKPTGVPVQLPPLATNDQYDYIAGTPLSVPAATGVLTNDNVHGEPATATLTWVQNGTGAPTVVVNADGSFVFTPAAGYGGDRLFTYQVCTAGGCALGTVTMHEVPLNHAPTAVAQHYQVVAGSTLTVAKPGLLTGASDPDGDAVSVGGVTTPSHGVVNTWSLDGMLSYTPEAGFSGTDSMSYYVTDAKSAASAWSTITIDVLPTDKPVGVDDGFTMTQDTMLTVPDASGVLANDLYAGKGQLQVGAVDQPAVGAVTLNPGGGLTFTPPAGYVGIIGFSYRPIANGVLGNWTTVTVHINASGPVAPQAHDDDYTVPSGQKLTVAWPGVLGNDEHAPGTGLSVSGYSSAQHGTVEIDPNGSLVYTPDAGFIGDDWATYTVNDGFNTSTATVHFTVTDPNQAGNTPPVAKDDAYSLTVGTILHVDAANGVLANDTDADGDPLTVIGWGSSPEGDLKIKPDGSVYFEVGFLFVGTVDIPYTVTDGHAVTQGVIHFTITDPNGGTGDPEPTPGPTPTPTPLPGGTPADTGTPAAPGTPAVPGAGTDTTSEPDAGSSLAQTGADSSAPALVALVLTALGGGLLLLRRVAARRRTR